MANSKMSLDEGKFVTFLLDVAEKRGRSDRLYYFNIDEYSKFPGYGLLLGEMFRKGYLEDKGDIVDGIEITPSGLEKFKEQCHK